jgi:5'-deoxynucleotidase YfbR-like HD superfamily hydrolase
MELNTLLWKSGCTKRWHCNIDHRLRESGDTVGAHTYRALMLLLMLNPLPSAHLIACLATHDTPEVFTGDMPGPMKRGAVKEMMDHYESEIIKKYKLPVPSGKDLLWVELCDKLDAILWVRERSPHLLRAYDWIEAWAKILSIADTLGVRDKVEELVKP